MPVLRFFSEGMIHSGSFYVLPCSNSMFTDGVSMSYGGLLVANSYCYLDWVVCLSFQYRDSIDPGHCLTSGESSILKHFSSVISYSCRNYWQTIQKLIFSCLTPYFDGRILTTQPQDQTFINAWNTVIFKATLHSTSLCIITAFFVNIFFK